MVDLGKRIGEMVESLMEDDSLFLVEASVKGNPTQPKVIIKIDGDQGVSIDTCAQISRKLGNEIEAEGLIDTRYNLEVSSPGLDQPLTLYRQYLKNIGRKVRLTLKDGGKAVGELMNVEKENLTINQETKVSGKKKLNYEERSYPFEEIDKANILVSFK